MRLRPLHLAMATALLCGTVAILAGPVSAMGSKPPKFSGALPGEVSCSLSAKVKFASPVTLSSTPTSATFKGKLTGCTASISGVTIKSGKIMGSFTGSPVDCTGPAAGTATGAFSATWKADVNGVVKTVTYGGTANLTATTVNSVGQALVTNSGGDVGLQLVANTTGSFAGDASLVAYSADSTSDVTSMCETKTTMPAGTGKGIKSLLLSGSMGFGPIGAMASDGAGFCAIQSTGTLNCWGGGADGALGNNNTTNSDVPVIDSVTNGSAITSDGTHSYCATLVSEDVDCWGLDTDGELGDAMMGIDSDVPVAVSGLSGALAVASDGDHSYCAVLTSGGVDCWGQGTDGELGNGATADSDTPVAVSDLSGVVALSDEGDDSYCAVTGTGAVDCWGDDSDGELGDGSTTAEDTPVSNGVTTAVSVVGDATRSYCAVLSAGGIECWGLGTDGELGNGASSTSHVPVAVTGISTAIAVASDGNKSFCALLADGAVSCWGLGTNGELGNGSTSNEDAPVAVSGMTDAVAIAGDGSDSYCAVLATEAVQCWGGGGSGQLGNNAGMDSSTPVTAGPMPAAVGLVGEGTGTFCAVIASNSGSDGNGVYCWGSNAADALGDGSSGGSSLVPEEVSDFTL